MKDVKYKPLYPNGSRKALSFTIDDGNLRYDLVLLSILKPRGIKGTFNLCSDRMTESREYYRSFYEGYGISNHVAYHPFAMKDGVTYTVHTPEEKNGAPSESDLYKIEGKPDGFYEFLTPRGYRHIADTDLYISYIEESFARLEEVFGKGSVRGFVWPFSEQSNAKIKEYLKSKGYLSVRKTGCTYDADGFAVPKDLSRWSYNANHDNLLEVADMFNGYADDGELKMMCFGVHSIDFETFGKWGDLEEYAERYGDRPEDFWYAPVDDIFAYSLAFSSLVTENGKVTNPTDIDLYIEYKGERLTVPAHTSVRLK